MELTLKQLTDLFTLSAETLMDYKEKAEDVLGFCQCQCKAAPVAEIKMAPEAIMAAINKREAVKAEPISEPTEPTEAPKIVPQSEEKLAADKLPEAPKEAQKKPIFKLADEPKKEDPKPLQPSDLLEPEPSEGGKDKKKLDDGKICALRRAGWTWDKIADEMHCSAQTALNHYNAYIRKMGKE